MSKEISNGFTLRAFVIGAMCSFFISIASPYGVLMIKGSQMTENFSTTGAMVMLLLLVLVVNTLLKAIGRAFGFSRDELLLVYVMMIVGCAIPTYGLMTNLLPVMTGVFYYATPENDLVNLVQPHVARWIAPENSEGVIKYFYEGLPKGEAIPWMAWIKPLLAWLPLLMALYVVMISMMVVLRKQWMERERLLFPLVQLPLDMVEEDEKGSLINPFFKNKMMWVGAALPFLIWTWNGLGHYFHFIHPIKLNWGFDIFRRSTWITFRLIFPIIGFSYLVNLNVAFSLWFFSILGTVQTGIMRSIGWSIGPRDAYCSSSPSVSHQAMGAIIVLVISGLWMARGHLKDVWRKAWKGDPTVDDSGEIMSYRAAMIGIFSGVLVIVVWLEMVGLRWYFTLMFLFAAFALFMALTRIVAEGGVAYAKFPLTPQVFVAFGVGSTVLGPGGLAALASTFVWSADIKTFVMASMANGLRLVETTRTKRKPIFWAALVAILVSIAGSLWITLHLGYKYGAINLHAWYFGGCPRVPYEEFMGALLLNPVAVDLRRWLFTGIGAGFMAFLMFMYHRFLWWPIHPIGFPVGNTLPLSKTWFSIFLAWLFKAVILRYGGPKLYKQIRPLFMGLIVGHLIVSGMWLVIDFFTEMTNNVVPF